MYEGEHEAYWRESVCACVRGNYCAVDSKRYVMRRNECVDKGQSHRSKRTFGFGRPYRDSAARATSRLLIIYPSLQLEIDSLSFDIGTRLQALSESD